MTRPIDSSGVGGGSSYYPNQNYLSTGGAPGHLETYAQPSKDIDTFIPPQGNTSRDSFIGNIFKSLLSSFAYILSGPSGCSRAQSPEEKSQDPKINQSQNPAVQPAPTSNVPDLSFCYQQLTRFQDRQYNSARLSSDHSSVSWGIIHLIHYEGNILLATPDCGKLGCEGFVGNRARAWQKFVDMNRDDKVDLFYTNKTAIVMNERFRGEAGRFYSQPYRYQIYTRLQPADKGERYFAQDSFDVSMKPAKALWDGFLASLKKNSVRVEYKNRPYPLFSYQALEGSEPNYVNIGRNTVFLSKGTFYNDKLVAEIPRDDPFLKPFESQLKALEAQWDSGIEKETEKLFLETKKQFFNALAHNELCLGVTNLYSGQHSYQVFYLAFYVKGQKEEVILQADQEGRLKRLRFKVPRYGYQVETSNLPPNIQAQLENLYEQAKKLAKK